MTIVLEPVNLAWLAAPFTVGPCLRCGKPVDTRKPGAVQDLFGPKHATGLWHEQCEQAAWEESGCGEREMKGGMPS